MTLNPEAETLRQLHSDDPGSAWRDFLEQYSAHLYQVCRISCADAEDAAECFVFVCEQLAANRFRRLRKFSPGGKANLKTWLQAVSRNLCVDWYRKTRGRRRVFRSVTELSAQDQEIFHRYFHQRLSVEDVLHQLRPQYPELTAAEVDLTVERLRSAMSRSQLWDLAVREMQLESLDANHERNDGASPADPGLDPEAAFAQGEMETRLRNGIEALSPGDRLIVRLRFEEDLTLQEIADVTGLKDPQAVDRRLRGLLARLREMLGKPVMRRGKNQAASV